MKAPCDDCGIEVDLPDDCTRIGCLYRQPTKVGGVLYWSELGPEIHCNLKGRVKCDRCVGIRAAKLLRKMGIEP